MGSSYQAEEAAAVLPQEPAAQRDVLAAHGVSITAEQLLADEDQEREDPNASIPAYEPPPLSGALAWSCYCSSCARLITRSMDRTEQAHMAEGQVRALAADRCDRMGTYPYNISILLCLCVSLCLSLCFCVSLSRLH